MLNMFKYVAAELAMHPLVYACTDFQLMLISGRGDLAIGDGMLTSVIEMHRTDCFGETRLVPHVPGSSLAGKKIHYSY